MLSQDGQIKNVSLNCEFLKKEEVVKVVNFVLNLGDWATDT